MRVEDVTAMVITRNESPNIGRALDALRWVRDVLVLDSYSEDETLAIAGRYPNVRVEQRTFDTFANQCNYGLSRIESPWVLSLDADYVLDAGWPDELARLDHEAVDGYVARFVYRVRGHPLRASLYPPRVVLYRRVAARYVDDGHGHKLVLGGQVASLRSSIAHDDRKPLGQWLEAQQRYADAEAAKLLRPTTSLGLADMVRKHTPFAPALALLYCLLWCGLVLDGRPGWHYTLQRTYFELLLVLRLADARLGDPPGASSSSTTRL